MPTIKKPRKKPAKAPNAKAKLRPDDTDEIYLPDGTAHDGIEGLIPVAFLIKYDAFVAEYLMSGDAPAAAKTAGFVGRNDQSQKAIASRLLQIPHVRTLIHQQAKATMAKSRITVERVYEEVAYTAFLDPGAAYSETGEPLPIGEMPEEVRRALTGYKVTEKTFGEDGSSIEREVKFGGKADALDKLMKLLRMVDNDKLVIVDGEEFQRAMEEGRERARAGRR